MSGVERIERYELLGELATGGMATVYLGRQRGPFGFSRAVAIKSMHPQFAKDEGFRAMFLDEATLTARIRHPNVVSTLDVVHTANKLLIVMEYVEGISLSALVRQMQKQSAKVDPAVAVAILSDVLHGLHAAHELRDDAGQPLDVIHRDVSPQNILVGVDGVSRILDFGVAKAASRRYVTQSDEIKGKLAYMSPQQVCGEPLDRRADVYAAGVVLWEVLAGERLFNSRNDAELMKKIVDETVVPPSFVAERAIPSELDAAVMRAISKVTEERWPTAESMARAIGAAVAPAPRSEVTALVQRLGAAEIAARTQLLASERIQLEPEAKLVADVLTAQATVVTRSAKAAAASGRWVMIAIGGVLTFVALMAAAFVFGLRSSKGTARPFPSALAATASAGASAPPASTPAASSGPTASSASAEPPASASADPVAPPLVASASPSAGRPRGSPRKPPAGAPSARARPSVDCRVPYTVDANGDRHFKPECVD